jgi:hypothetical protein
VKRCTSCLQRHSEGGGGGVPLLEAAYEEGFFASLRMTASYWEVAWTLSTGLISVAGKGIVACTTVPLSLD